ncbi:RNA 2'-phosphotransferase [Halobacteriales archaeon QS_1_68_20]|nr:MAG: RNA 2'-phosphotransferase [Halobacteriales archaeon QS_1_68_20]
MSALRECPDHSYFGGEACPTCGAEGEVLLDADRRRRLSKFLSGALRHFPDDAGLDLDGRGWADYDAVVEAVVGGYTRADAEHVRAVAATDPKGRFEVEGGPDRIRAAYGHSVPVDLDAGDGASDEVDSEIPDVLYHGTAPRNLDAIREEGLVPMERREVHLSGSVDEACEGGRRHADDPAVLEVGAAAMWADDRRITRRGEGVYTADRVPPAYLSVAETPERG